MLLSRQLWLSSLRLQSFASPAAHVANLRKVLALLLDTFLHPKQQRCLPLVQLAHLIELEQLVCELLLVTFFHSFRQISQQLVLSCLREAWIEVAIRFQCSVCRDHVCRCEVADTGFEQVLLYRPLHQIVVYARFRDALVVGDSLIIVTFECGDIGELEV